MVPIGTIGAVHEEASAAKPTFVFISEFGNHQFTKLKDCRDGERALVGIGIDILEGCHPVK